MVLAAGLSGHRPAAAAWLKMSIRRARQWFAVRGVRGSRASRSDSVTLERIDSRSEAQMFNDTDTVGYAFKRAFYRVDGVTMYVCWLIWAGILIWAMFDAEASRIEVLVKLMIGLMSPFLYVLLGLMRIPGLLSAVIIAAINIWFLSVYF